VSYSRTEFDYCFVELRKRRKKRKRRMWMKTSRRMKKRMLN
jgi:hypothetical protein